MPLTTKIQYKNFEPGEFADSAKRSFDETLSLIEKFPWADQRDHLQVNLTNPSVTIADGNGTYLKLALFYSGKFVLHYLDANLHLFTKSFTDYKESYPYIKAYFENPSFPTDDFKLENTWLQKNLVHFTDKDFRYSLTPQRIYAYLFSTSGINFILLLVFLVFMLLNPAKMILPVVLLMIPFLFLLGGGLNLILFANYYRYAKGKTIIMSKGHNVFYFGDNDNPEQFNKTDILQFKVYGNTKNSKSPIGGFLWIDIELKNARHLVIPNLLIDSEDLTRKLFEYPCIQVTRGIPFIPSSASTPS